MNNELYCIQLSRYLDHEQQKKRKIHVKERRKNIRNAEGLLKKHRSKDFGK